MVANSLPELVEAMTSHALENGDGVELVQGKTKTWPVWIPIGSSYDTNLFDVFCFEKWCSPPNEWLIAKLVKIVGLGRLCGLGFRLDPLNPALVSGLGTRREFQPTGPQANN